MAYKNIFLVMHAFGNFTSNAFTSKEQLTFI